MRHPFMLIIAAIVCLAASPALADRGMLQITSDPGGGRVMINGERKGNTPADVGQSFIIQLAKGDYVIEMVKPVDDRSELFGRAEVFVADDTVQPVKVKLAKRVVFSDSEKDRLRRLPLPRMMQIPAGSFLMGSPDSEPERISREGPQHRVTISRPFEMGVAPVTFEQWDQCYVDGGCNHNPDDQGWGRGARPVINVSWSDIQEYLRWLSGKAGQRYRLPTEAEWEYSARGGTTTTYYWGNEIGKNNANCKGCGSKWDERQTAPVESFRKNSFGLYDMAGNVGQFVEDCSHDTYSGAPVNGSPWSADVCHNHVVRGGSWIYESTGVRVAFRFLLGGVNDRMRDVGFRLARTLP